MRFLIFLHNVNLKTRKKFWRFFCVDPALRRWDAKTFFRFSSGLTLLALILLKGVACAESAPAAIVGTWLTEDRDAIIALYPCGENICGKFRWLKDDSADNVLQDHLNPDPKKRRRPLCNLEFMTGFKPEPEGLYDDGAIYSPRHGNIFNATLTLETPDTLKVHGYILFSFLGDSQTWTRVMNAPTCINHA